MLHSAISSLLSWLKRNQTFLTASVGSAIVAVWTVLRHITNGINFDVIGQIGVAGQWVHGLHSGATFGATNYLLKIPLYMLVNVAEWVPPVMRILLLALICSVGAYLLLYWLARRIVTLYGVRNFTLLNLGMLWLALLAGRVFWVDYANSRNLEVAGGLAVLYLVLRLWEKGASKRQIAGLFVLSSLVFFADPLQLYIVGGGLILFAVMLVIREGGKVRTRALQSSVVLILSFVVARLLTWLSTIVLPVSYLQPPRITATFGVDTITTAFQNTVTSTLRIFDINFFSKALSVNTLRQVGGIILLGGAAYLITRSWRALQKRPARLLGWLVVWNYAVYFLSGNALTPITERYLILVPICIVLLLGLCGDVVSASKLRRISSGWFVLVAMSAILLSGAIAINWSDRYRLDQPMFKLASFVQENSYDFVVTSRGFAIPSNYYTGYSHAVVPTMCADNTHIVTTNLFYDQAAYSQKLGHTQGTIAVVLPDEGVVSDPFRCSKEVILAQLGRPLRQFALPGVGWVYEYDGTSAPLRQL